jgi:hypothetical protein
VEGGKKNERKRKKFIAQHVALLSLSLARARACVSPFSFFFFFRFSFLQRGVPLLEARERDGRRCKGGIGFISPRVFSLLNPRRDQTVTPITRLVSPSNPAARNRQEKLNSCR